MTEPVGEFQVTILCSLCGAPMLFDTHDDRHVVQTPTYAEIPLACTKCDNHGELELVAFKGERMQ